MTTRPKMMRRKKMTKILRNTRISTKIIAGFSVVLLLLLIVGFVGLNGMNGTVKRVDQAEAVNRMVKTMQRAHQNEKDFIIYGDERFAKKVDTDISELINDVSKTKKNLDLDASKQKMDQILSRAEAYRNAFHRYVDTEQVKNTLMSNMQEKAGNAITKLEKSGQDQLDQSADLTIEISNSIYRGAGVDELMAKMRQLGSRSANADDANNMIKWFLEARRNEKELIITGDHAYYENVQRLIEKITKLGNLIKDSLETEADAKHIAVAMEALGAYDTALDEFVTKMKQQERIDQELVKAAQATQTVCDDLWAEQRKRMASDIRRSNVIIYLICGVALVIGSAVTAWITLSIRKSIGYAVSKTTQVADGNLKETIEIKSMDEIGELLTAMQKMVDKLRKMLRDILTGVDTLVSSSTELSNISEQLAEGSEESSERSATVVAGAEEMSGNMNSVAAAAEQASQNVGMVSEAAEEMATTIDEIVRNTEKGRDISANAVSKASSASKKMAYLGKAAQEVGNVTETITEISEQTNLLALNATIEAARAGEAGKGFAVVANEIKNLAKQTAEATLRIRNQIEGIQDSTTSTIVEIQEVTEVIHSVNDVVGNIASAIEQQSGATREISTNVAHASKGIQEVTEKVTSSSGVATTISMDISDVNQSVQEIATASSQVRVSANGLSRLSDQLKNMANHFIL